ncbi:hypothetical protein [Clostridium sp. 001]|uniref:hypothetical protein n=1 Tax=Clostridium sp. 001 TaxID=1970093 RepID=UPI001C2BF295|nr:hypothetical protein [Clostridium sp. 001]QXE18699.1 hypothetical protein B5S50_07530 [Clostridium sp. 001]
MNVAQECYRTGKMLNKAEEGKKLFEIFKKVDSYVSKEAWDTFNQMRPPMKNYYSFPSALEVIRFNNDNQQLPGALKSQVKEIINCNQIKEFCDLCIQMGNALDDVTNKLFQLSIPNSFSNINTPPKLKRALTDLYISFQKTGITKTVFSYYRNINFMETLEEYEKERTKLNSIPFSREHRKLIKKLKCSKCDEKSLYFMEIFISIVEVIKQIIFESHLGLILDINEKDIIKYKANGKNRIISYIIDLKPEMLNIINWRGSIITFNITGKQQFGLVNKRKLAFGINTKLNVGGILYPNDDVLP